jgi:hypothetical protein
VEKSTIKATIIHAMAESKRRMRSPAVAWEILPQPVTVSSQFRCQANRPFPVLVLIPASASVGALRPD